MISQDVEGVGKSLIDHFKVQNVRNPHREKIGKYKMNQIHRIFPTTFIYIDRLLIKEIEIN